jgi:hypothetical protein
MVRENPGCSAGRNRRIRGLKDSKKYTVNFYWVQNFRPIFASNFYHMANGASKFLYWILFLASTAAFIFAIAAHFEYLTLILPFVCTFFVKALDII